MSVPAVMSAAERRCILAPCHKRVSGKCDRGMCKTCCIYKGGCVTAVKHEWQFLTPRLKDVISKRQAKDRIPISTAIANDWIDPTLSIEDAAQFTKDLATACAQSLRTAAHPFDASASSASTSMTHTTPDTSAFATNQATSASVSSLLAPSISMSMTPASALVSQLLAPSTSMLMTPASALVTPPLAASTSMLTTPTTALVTPLSSLPQQSLSTLAPIHQTKQPKHTQQMGPSWNGQFQYDQKMKSESARRAEAKAAKVVALKREVTLVWWDKDDEEPTVIALQDTNDPNSDIPNWPEFSLTDCDALLPSLGDDIRGFAFYHLRGKMWKTASKLSHAFTLEKGAQLLLRRRGVVKCYGFDSFIAQHGATTSTSPPHLFKKITNERKAIRDALKNLHDNDEDDCIEVSAISRQAPLLNKHVHSPSKSSITSMSNLRSIKIEPEEDGNVKKRRRLNHLMGSSDHYPIEIPDTPPRLPLSSMQLSKLKPSPYDISATYMTAYMTPAPLSPVTQQKSNPVYSSLSPTAASSSESLPSASEAISGPIWPNGRYTIDVRAGIDRMESPEFYGRTQPERFKAVFGVPFKSSTFSDANKRWNSAGEHIRAALLAAGRTPDGLYDRLRGLVKIRGVRNVASRKGKERALD